MTLAKRTRKRDRYFLSYYEIAKEKINYCYQGLYPLIYYQEKTLNQLYYGTGFLKATKKQLKVSTKRHDLKIIDLPDDLLLMILKYLPIMKLGKIMLTCKDFYDLSQNYDLWIQLCYCNDHFFIWNKLSVNELFPFSITGNLDDVGYRLTGKRTASFDNDYGTNPRSSRRIRHDYIRKTLIKYKTTKEKENENENENEKENEKEKETKKESKPIITPQHKPNLDTKKDLVCKTILIEKVSELMEQKKISDTRKKIDNKKTYELDRKCSYLEHGEKWLIRIFYFFLFSVVFSTILLPFHLYGFFSPNIPQLILAPFGFTILFTILFYIIHTIIFLPYFNISSFGFLIFFLVCCLIIVPIIYFALTNLSIALFPFWVYYITKLVFNFLPNQYSNIGPASTRYGKFEWFLLTFIIWGLIILMKLKNPSWLNYQFSYRFAFTPIVCMIVPFIFKKIEAYKKINNLPSLKEKFRNIIIIELSFISGALLITEYLHSKSIPLILILHPLYIWDFFLIRAVIKNPLKSNRF
ncbi:f-box only protein [Anaeramoeba flamelloides]|uniref:F-box only protein n=1 Tax=Anaeramoeba flamelloides TaxID=1746091 RepID=A0ABQ8YAL5_9EUKA|nr:f-box only protein [Anaeramoeba flamelloides]